MMKFINIKMLIISISIFLPFSLFAQSPTFTKQANMNPNRMYVDSTAKMPVLNTDRTFATNKDSIGQFWMRTDSVKMFARFPGNIIKAIATEDSVRSVLNNSIRNQFFFTQPANFNINGVGAGSRFVGVNADNAAFQRYFTMGRDAIDTTKQLWSLGVTGTPGGSPFHAGGTFLLRSYNTSGAFLSNAFTIGRTGNATIAGSLNTGNTITSAAGIIAGGSLQAATGLSTAGAILQNTTTTVTGDYTVLASDLYINVNNSANCTITLFAPVATTGGQGRLCHVKKISNNAATVTVVVSGGANIDDGGSVVISSYKDALTFHDDGTNYWIY